MLTQENFCPKRFLLELSTTKTPFMDIPLNFAFQYEIRKVQ